MNVYSYFPADNTNELDLSSFRERHRLTKEKFGDLAKKWTAYRESTQGLTEEGQYSNELTYKNCIELRISIC